MKIYFLIIFIISAILLTTCKDNPSSPPEDTEPTSSRNYSWTIDTLNCPLDPMFRMWASSPTNIWTTSNGAWEQSISRYDGIRWKSRGIQGIAAPWAIYGFDSLTVFIGSSNANIWKYDGENYSLFVHFDLSEYDNLVNENIWGKSADDFYAFGAGADSNGNYNVPFVAHYLNGEWTILDMQGLIGLVSQLYRVDDKLYLRLIKIGGVVSVDSTLLYEYSDQKFKVLFRSKWAQGYTANISLVDDQVYFIFGNTVAVRDGDHFNILFTVNDSKFYHRLWGREPNDIFLLKSDGLAHYNGSNFEYLFHFSHMNELPWTQIYGAALFEKDIIFLVYEPTVNLNLIYRGKL